MVKYQSILHRIITKGEHHSDRTGVGTRRIFGHQVQFDLSEGFPLLTTKRIHWRSVVAELIWFLRGSTNVKDLQAMGCKIWDEWADENGDLGPVYGKQWRSWGVDTPVDQITDLIHNLKVNPNSRRHIVTAWNPNEIGEMALPPCHCLFQFAVMNDKKLHCQLYQRSADAFLGVPFNIASYALLTHILAKLTGLQPGVFVHTFGDLHIYDNHREQVSMQLLRTPRDLPTLTLPDNLTWDPESWSVDDFQVLNYNPHPTIKAEVAV